MSWHINIREKHLRKFLIILYSALFFYLNWGHTFGFIKHIAVLLKKYIRPEGYQFANALDDTALDFESTIRLLCILAIVYFVCDYLLRRFDWDCQHRENDNKNLRQGNSLLVQQIENSNKSLSAHISLLEQIAERHAMLSKYQDRIVELSLELDKLSLKSKRKPANKDNDGKAVEPDLFHTPIPKIKRPAYRKRKLSPKF